MTITDDDALIARADWHLHNWRRWESAPDGHLGYPSKSAGLSSGGVSGEDAFAELCESADAQAAMAADAVLMSLEPLHQAALYNRYFAAVYAYRERERVEREAKLDFMRRMIKRGFV